MITALLFWGLTITCCGFAAGYGGWAGRQIAALYLIACVATIDALFAQIDWRYTNLPVFIVDLGLLFALFRVVLLSDRWFPVWFTGFHLVAVASHLASMVAPRFTPKLYFALQGFWSIPMLMTLVIGVGIDRQKGITDGPNIENADRRIFRKRRRS